MRILREGARTSVIGLNLQDNTMCVYHGERRVVTEVKDLVEAIETVRCRLSRRDPRSWPAAGRCAEPGRR